MKRIIATLIGISLLLFITLIFSNWVKNGGWPSSGPTGEELPIHIQYVTPADGQRGQAIYGFCVHFNYIAGHGLGEEPQETIRYYLDGRNVTRNVVDIVRLEYGYPDPVGEPCYKQPTTLSLGWHTAKTTYNDIAGEKFEYTWRFQVFVDE